MASLIANSGRIVLSPALAIKSRRSFQPASLCRRAPKRAQPNLFSNAAHLHERLQRSSPLNCASAVLTAAFGRSGLFQPSQHQSRRTISAHGGGVNWKIGGKRLHGLLNRLPRLSRR
jgi:hypothetical protein